MLRVGSRGRIGRFGSVGLSLRRGRCILRWRRRWPLGECCLFFLSSWRNLFFFVIFDLD